MTVVTKRALWATTILLGICLSIGLHEGGLSLIVGSAYPRVLILGIVPIIASCERLIVGDHARRLAAVIESIGLFSAISLAGAIASYMIVAHTSGFVDDGLATMDHALGFDWLVLYRFVSDHPGLTLAERLSYDSIFVTPVVVLGVLAWTGRMDRARAFIAAFAFALAIALLIFVFCPAKSALAHYVGTHPPYMPTTGLQHVDIIDRLRAGTLTQIDLGDLTGLITFPSVHTVAALMFVWAGWPVARLRPALVIVNGAMLLSVPIGGTHYLTDMIGGALVAGVAIGMLYMPALIRRLWSDACRTTTAVYADPPMEGPARSAVSR